MPTSKFKIVFTSKSGGEAGETVEFTCSDPLAGVKGYVDEMVNGNGGSRGWVAAKVYPADEKALHEVGHKCCGGKKCKPKVEESKLFGGYCMKGPMGKPESFATPESRWIDSVGFRHPFYLTVNFLHRDPITYQLGFDVFEAWKSWVESGGSAGQFFNANVKGNETF
jgi:hypothetical protein